MSIDIQGIGSSVIAARVAKVEQQKSVAASGIDHNHATVQRGLQADALVRNATAGISGKGARVDLVV